eukprot:CAMPEP_0203691330 /NCGR_PEP_ID=MMETSP0091-20130426/3655_1 /ASSEMBLY_ACC=CAM_ASM_001089 /TAXON_ID=426623 /ORGANISM="Chaetoceros affinis, Strain CCMP159" /LENGTH=294 /DNA_ID=CAMNT_0050561799 /DNA_START=74 /DNA_END=958 /DNA_ORIENTATION=+
MNIHQVISLTLLLFLGLVQYISASDVVITDWMIEMLEAVNLERSKEGADPLCYNEKIILAAQVHNQDMIDNDTLTHTGSDGSKPGERIEDQGYQWKLYGENVARGQRSVSGVMTSWMKSAGHRKNILNKDATHFGAAKGGDNRFWTQVFASAWDSAEGCMSTGPPSCVEDGSEIIYGRVEPRNMLQGTCSDLASYPQYIDSVCSLVPREEAEKYSPATLCPDTCGTSANTAESPDVKVLGMIERNGNPVIYEKTCGWLARQKPGLISKACNLDFSLWDKYAASSACCDTCKGVN